MEFALQHGGRALIADEMGLGKTVQACCTTVWPVHVQQLCTCSTAIHMFNSYLGNTRVSCTACRCERWHCSAMWLCKAHAAASVTPMRNVLRCQHVSGVY